MKIFLSAGHGGVDPGAVWNGIKEKDFNLKVALCVWDLLLINGFECMLNRTDDVTISNATNVTMANNYKADYFLDIHHNAGGGDGAEIIHSIYYGKGVALSKCIATEFANSGQNIRKVYSKPNSKGNADYFETIRNTKMTAIILEYAFVDNKQDIEILFTENGIFNEARAIVRGLCNYLGRDFIQSVPAAASLSDLEIGINKAIELGLIVSPEYWQNNAKAGKIVEGAFVENIFKRLGKLKNI